MKYRRKIRSVTSQVQQADARTRGVVPAAAATAGTQSGQHHADAATRSDGQPAGAAEGFPAEAEAGATSRKEWTAGGPAKKSNKFVFLPSPFRIFASKSETMEIKGKFDHFNINVTDLERSIDFYGRALGLHEKGRQKAEDGSFELVFLGDGESNFHLELTWLRDKEGAYELGDNESHLCIRVAGDYDAVREYHRANGWVCFENHEMGLYFINDPDDYWIEVLPLKR